MTATPKLTASQRELLNLIAAGYSTQEIADTLGIKRRTAKFRIDGLRAKFGVKHKRQLIAVAQQMEAK